MNVDNVKAFLRTLNFDVLEVLKRVRWVVLRVLRVLGGYLRGSASMPKVLRLLKVLEVCTLPSWTPRAVCCRLVPLQQALALYALLCTRSACNKATVQQCNM